MVRQHDERWGWTSGHQRELVVEGVPVSRVIVLDYTMRIGGALVRMAGIAGVGTNVTERHKGYSRRLLTDTVAFMQREGYDISMLFGIPDFYHKFGYAVCLPSHAVTVQTRDAERARQGLTVRRATAADMPAIRRIYNATNESRTCSLVRPDSWCGWTRGSDWGLEWEALVAVDGRDHVAGYVALDASDTCVKAFEIGASPRSRTAEVFESLLRSLADAAVARRCSEVSMLLPADHPFAVFARGFGCSAQSTFPRNAGGMGRIVNLRPLFEKLLPEMSRRATLANCASMNGAADLLTDIGRVRLRMQSGRVTLGAGNTTRSQARLPQSSLLQLILGYRGVDDLMGDDDVSIGTNAAALLRVVFPPDCPHIWQGDHF